MGRCTKFIQHEDFHFFFSPSSEMLGKYLKIAHQSENSLVCTANKETFC